MKSIMFREANLFAISGQREYCLRCHYTKTACTVTDSDAVLEAAVSPPGHHERDILIHRLRFCLSLASALTSSALMDRHRYFYSICKCCL